MENDILANSTREAHANRKVNIFVVGAAKAGTTTLHNLLCQRPDMSLPNIKETNYFSFPDKSSRKFNGPFGAEFIRKNTPDDLASYQQLFDPAKEYWSECCPSYLFVPTAAEEIFKYNPESRIVILLRDPAERAFSNYLHLVRDGAEQLEFEDAIKNEAARIEAGWSWFWQITQQGYYSDQVKRYLDLFGEKHVKILLFDQLTHHPTETMRELEDFLNIPQFDYCYSVDSNQSGAPKPHMRRLHQLILRDSLFNKILRFILPTGIRKTLGSKFKKVTITKEKMQAKDREKLQNLYRRDIEKLSGITGLDLSGWIKKQPIRTDQ